MADYKALAEQVKAAQAATQAALVCYEHVYALWKEMLQARVNRRASKYAVAIVERSMSAAWDQYQAARAAEDEARAAEQAEFKRYLAGLQDG